MIQKKLILDDEFTDDEIDLVMMEFGVNEDMAIRILRQRRDYPGDCI